jgi:Cysteine-rich CPCC
MNLLKPCPSCGYCTLNERGGFEICSICWWEDDGQDNENANDIRGGPNYHLSLTRARINYIAHGISDPDRKDLIAEQKKTSEFSIGRKFVLLDDKDSVSEPASGWEGNLNDEVEL